MDERGKAVTQQQLLKQKEIEEHVTGAATSEWGGRAGNAVDEAWERSLWWEGSVHHLEPFVQEAFLIQLEHFAGHLPLSIVLLAVFAVWDACWGLQARGRGEGLRPMQGAQGPHSPTLGADC